LANVAAVTDKTRRSAGGEFLRKVVGYTENSSCMRYLACYTFAFVSREHLRYENTKVLISSSSSSSFICPIIQQYAHLRRYNFRRAGQQGPTRALTAALKRVIKQLTGTYSITQVKYYKRAN